MSEKETSQKIVTKYDRKVQQRKEAEAKAKKQKKIDRLVGILIFAVIAVVLVSIPVSRYIAKNTTYITVGGHDITKLEYDYHFNMAYDEYLNTYGSYISMMGLDTTKDLDKQAYSDTMTWQDYFDQLAVDSLQHNKALLNEATAAGFTYDTAKDYETFAEAMKTGASQQSVTVSKYYKLNFGKYATASNIKPFVEESYFVAAYYNAVAEEKGATEEEILAYYEANKKEYDRVNYLYTEIAAEVTETSTEDEIATAMADAKTKAEAALEVIGEEGKEVNNMLYGSVHSTIRDWMFDEARVEGDSTIVEDTESNKYYVVMYKDRYRDETPTASVRTIMTTTVAGEDILKEYVTAGSTEEAFIDLVSKYSEDAYTSATGGLYEELGKSSTESDLNTWIFDEDRKPGDVTIIKDGTVTYVLYYIEEGRPSWQARIGSTLLGENLTEYLTEIKANCEVQDPKGNLDYLKVVESTPATDVAE